MYRRFVFSRIFCFTLLCTISIFSHAATPPQLLFSIHGSNTLGAELTAKLLQGWLAERGATQVQRVAERKENEYRVRGFDSTTQQWQEVLVTAHGSGTGYEHLQQGSGEIAASSRPIKTNEINALAKLDNMKSAAVEHVVAIDGLAMIVHPTNPVDKLSVEQLQAIFSGEITRWEQLNAGVGIISLYARDEHSGTWDSFQSMVLGKKSLAAAQRFEANKALADAVLADKNAIGFVSMAAVGEAKLLAVYEGQAQALQPNHLTVATEDYVLSRRLFMYTPQAIAEVEDFTRFVQSDVGQKLVAEVGYISQKIEAVMPAFYHQLPQDFQRVTANAERLTVNFRFTEGKVNLDNKGLKDIYRLAQFMRQYPQHELLLVGFADPKSTDQKSKLLSRLRTKLVNSQLIRMGVYHAQVVGLGDDLLVAATDEQAGRHKNRRVEVWIRPRINPATM